MDEKEVYDKIMNEIETESEEEVLVKEEKDKEEKTNIIDTEFLDTIEQEMGVIADYLLGTLNTPTIEDYRYDVCLIVKDNYNSSNIVRAVQKLVQFIDVEITDKQLGYKLYKPEEIYIHCYIKSSKTNINVKDATDEYVHLIHDTLVHKAGLPIPKTNIIIEVVA